MLSVSRTYLEMPVVVHEFVAHAVPPERLGEYEVVNRRARLSRTAVPPDQLNPRGCAACFGGGGAGGLAWGGSSGTCSRA